MAVSDPDAYETLDDGPEVEIKVKGSRFLGHAFHGPSEAYATARLQDVRRRYHDATHHCWATLIGEPPDLAERFDDDGEPSRTAGPPILNAIRRAGVVDALVVVTRYYGGTKLGTGGLARAYGEAADAAVAAAPRRVCWTFGVLRVEFDFGDLGAVESVIARAPDAILDTARSFDPRPGLRLTVKRSRMAGLQATLTEATAGRVVVSEVE